MDSLACTKPFCGMLTQIGDDMSELTKEDLQIEQPEDGTLPGHDGITVIVPKGSR